MIKVNLFDPWKASVYGTATTRDVLAVAGAAAMYCLVVGSIVSCLMYNIFK